MEEKLNTTSSNNQVPEINEQLGKQSVNQIPLTEKDEQNSSEKTMNNSTEEFDHTAKENSKLGEKDAQMENSGEASSHANSGNEHPNTIPQNENAENSANNEAKIKDDSRKKRLTLTPSKVNAMSFSEVVDAVGLLLQQEELPKEKDIDMLENAFLKKKEQLEKDEDKKDELADAQVQALRLNDLISDYRIKFREYSEQLEKQQQEATEKRKELVQRLDELVKSTEEFGSITRKFREIESEWRAFAHIPHDLDKDLQEQYSALRDSFYDLKQINDDFRDIDFKKNLEAKEELIERANELANSNNPAQANREIGELHAKWKEIGPVAKELRDEIWERFTEVSKLIRDRGQEFFNNRKEEEAKNLELKKKICERVEDINYDALTSHRQWNQKKEEVIALQQQWKEVGSVPRSESNAIYKRFRAACDVFFSKRALALKEIHEQFDTNYHEKLAIVEEAESLAKSDNWKDTAEHLKELQKKWNEIGSVGKKNNELWNRFRAACDTFFNARKENFKNRRKEESSIVEKKKELLAKAEEMLKREVSNEIDVKKNFSEELYNLIDEFKKSGYLPPRLSQKLHDKFYSTTNAIFEQWKLDHASRKMEGFAEKVEQMALAGDKDKLRNEITFNLRRKERLLDELKTAENSLQLMTSSSNWGDTVLKDVEKKNKAILHDIELIDEKIALIKEKLAEMRKDTPKE